MDFKEIIESERLQIVDILIAEGWANATIGYEEFLKLYSNYKENMSEEEFAYTIGLNYNKLKFMRTRGTKSVILKQKASEELKNEIINELTLKGYTNKKISYNELVQLYYPYRKMITEKEFAKIIGIKYGGFQSAKHKGKRVEIFKVKPIPKQLKNKILNEINIEEINYIQFIELYKKNANEVSEVQFALLLGINERILRAMKKDNSKIICLKKARKISIKRENEIRQELIIKGYANKKISYEEFLHMYSYYKEEIEEREFAEILGVSEINYDSMKWKNKKVIILKTEVIEKEIIYRINNDERILSVTDRYIDNV